MIHDFAKKGHVRFPVDEKSKPIVLKPLDEITQEDCTKNVPKRRKKGSTTTLSLIHLLEEPASVEKEILQIVKSRRSRKKNAFVISTLLIHDLYDRNT